MQSDNNCASTISHSKVKIEDANGRKVIFDNPERIEYLKIRIDGCLIHDGKKVDYALEKDERSILIELKGGGVEKGLAQAIESAKFWRERRPKSIICGLIICTSFPSTINTTVQAKKAQFRKACNGPVHVLVGDRVLIFDNVFKSTGVEAR